MRGQVKLLALHGVGLSRGNGRAKRNTSKNGTCYFPCLAFSTVERTWELAMHDAIIMISNKFFNAN